MSNPGGFSKRFRDMHRELAVVLAVVLVGLVGANPTGADSAASCLGQRIELKTVADVQALAESARSNPGACPARVTQALEAMSTITKDKHACTMRKAAAINGFVDQYLRGPTEAEDVLPRALADFAVAYGMQVSRICSNEMVDKFARKADALLHDKLGADEYGKVLAFKQYLVDESPVGVLLSPLIKTGEVILPSDLMQLMPDVAASLKFAVPAVDNAQWLTDLCANTLRPLYEPTLLPLAHLIRAGFNSRHGFKVKLNKRDARFWPAAVFLCEGLRLADISKGDEPERVAITDELREAAPALASQQKLRADDEQVQPVAGTLMAAYQSDEQVDGKIVSSSVKSLVKAFDANKDEVERLRERILHRGMRILKVMLKKGQYSLMLKTLMKMIRVKEGADSSKLDEARTAIIEAVNSSGGDAYQSATLQRANSRLVSRHERKGDPTGTVLILLVIFIVCSAVGSVIKMFREEFEEENTH